MQDRDGIYHDATKPEKAALLSEMLASEGIEGEPEFPVTIFGGVVFDGWESEGTTGKKLKWLWNNVWRGIALKWGQENLETK